jgi:hypothetical protein
MFREALVDGESAVIFRAGDVSHLAAAILKVLSDPLLYEALSARSETAWSRIQLPVTMGGLITAWLQDTAGQIQWLKDHNLSSDTYGDRISKIG